MVFVAVGAVEDDPFDVLGPKDLLQNLDVDEVLLERLALVLSDRLFVAHRALFGIHAAHRTGGPRNALQGSRGP
jgi:hypothetical protein